MKVICILLASALPFAVQASPITEAEGKSAANPILEARDVYCTLGEQVHSHVGCYYGPRATDGGFRTWIEPNMRFGVNCWTRGEAVGPQGNTRWDWIPGWGCYVSARWTNRNCERELTSADHFVYDLIVREG